MDTRYKGEKIMKQVGLSLTKRNLKKMKEKQQELGVPVATQIRMAIDKAIQSNLKPKDLGSENRTVRLSDEQVKFLEDNNGSKFLNQILEEMI